MKKLLIVLFLLISINLFAQDSTLYKLYETKYIQTVKSYNQVTEELNKANTLKNQLEGSYAALIDLAKDDTITYKAKIEEITNKYNELIKGIDELTKQRELLIGAILTYKGLMDEQRKLLQ